MGLANPIRLELAYDPYILIILKYYNTYNKTFFLPVTYRRFSI